MQRKRNEESQPIKKRRFLSFALEWQVETALKVYVILKGFALKNLHPNESIVRISHIRSKWQTMSFRRPQGGRISIKVNMKEGIPRRAYALARNNMTVILNGTQWSEKSPVKWAYCKISPLRSRWQVCHSDDRKGGRISVQATVTRDSCANASEW